MQEPDDDFGFNEETELFFDSKVYSPNPRRGLHTMSQFDAIDEALDIESEYCKAPKEHDLVNVSDEEDGTSAGISNDLTHKRTTNTLEHSFTPSLRRVRKL